MRDRSPWNPESPEGARLRRSATLARPSRRRFLSWVGGAAAALGLLPQRAASMVVPDLTAGGAGAQAAAGPAGPAGPGGGPAGKGRAPVAVPRRVVAGPRCIASGNGLGAVERALSRLDEPGVPLTHAAVSGVNLVENDPDDMSVGYGGLPNEDGVVELDSAVMDGATHRAGSVGSLRNIKNPASVALKVLERTDHVMLVGDGALRFARAHGFAEEELLTDKARRAWLRWRETHSSKDDWLPTTLDAEVDIERPGGTIHLSLLDGSGNIACVTTTSGLAYKIPGRVGDSPIIGVGLYCTNEVGSCGSTGRGESVIIDCGSFAVVEHMRHGRSPQEACLEVLSRIARHAPGRHRDADGKPDFNVQFYAMSIDGDYAGAALKPRGRFAVADREGGVRHEDCATPA